MDLISIQAAYRRYARVYDATFGAIFAAGRRRILAQLNRHGGQRILEVGVGTGISLPGYRRDNTIVGIDISKDMLDIARRRVERRGLTNVETLREMDAEQLDFPDGSFDTVVAMYVMTVVPHPERVMAELRRVCKPDGDIYLLNHVMDDDEGLLQATERRLARFSARIGWRPDVTLDSLVDIAAVELVSVDVVPPFRLFRLMRFRNRPAPVRTEAYRVTAPGGSHAGPRHGQPSLENGPR
ncbi:MAG: class I SAM-dependent methyltransferase [Alphaproteobacteria bacterium]